MWECETRLNILYRSVNTPMTRERTRNMFLDQRRLINDIDAMDDNAILRLFSGPDTHWLYRFESIAERWRRNDTLSPDDINHASIILRAFDRIIRDPTHPERQRNAARLYRLHSAFFRYILNKGLDEAIEQIESLSADPPTSRPK